MGRECSGRIAIVQGEEHITYGALAGWVGALAAKLSDLGVRRGDVVAVAAGRRPAQVAAQLAALSLGVAYVPVDLDYPPSRVGHVLSDCGAKLLVHGDAGEAAKLQWSGPLLDAHDLQRGPRPLPSHEVQEMEVAYVIYTSGSTGLPKGVVVHHGALRNFLGSMRVRPGLTEQDVLLSVTSPSFDIAALEFYLPILVGGRLVLSRPDDLLSPKELSRIISQEAVTALQATPGFWALLAESSCDLTSVVGLCGGEALPAALSVALQPRLRALWNMYGPTETTVWSSIDEMRGADVHLGAPIANTWMVVTDPRGRTVERGVPGDLMIGGHGVAYGYHGRPALTAERFVPDPTAGAAGARLYDTGDVALMSLAGRITHRGRKDFQLKLRGYRIEPGEIEAALLEDPRVQAAVVTAKPGATGELMLVAYVVVDGPVAAPDLEALRQGLRARVPAYMVPAAMVVLDKIPRTPNGKTDLRALPPPGALEPAEASPTGAAAPLDEVERRLVSLVGELLGRVPDLDANFFELGGHSIMAARAAARIEREFNVAIPLKAFFEAPTVRRLAEVVRRGASAPRRIQRLARGRG